MRLASRSACAARAVRRPASPPSAPRDPRGRPARAPWPRCRAQSAARSCSRSTGKMRPASRGRTRPAGGARRRGGRSWGRSHRVPGRPRRGAPETAERRSPRPPWGAPERAPARASGSASCSPRIPRLACVLSHLCPGSEQPRAAPTPIPHPPQGLTGGAPGSERGAGVPCLASLANCAFLRRTLRRGECRSS